MHSKHRNLHPENQQVLPHSHSPAQLGHNHLLTGTELGKHPSCLHFCRSSFLDGGFPPGPCNSAVHLKGLSRARSWGILWAETHTETQSGAETVSVRRRRFLPLCEDPGVGGGHDPHTLKGANTLACFSGSCASAQTLRLPTRLLELLDAIHKGHLGDELVTLVGHKRGSKTPEWRGHTQN